MITITADGACSGNGQANPSAGWAAILRSDGNFKIISGKLPGKQTNNRAELTAVLEAFRALKVTAGDITLRFDSDYVGRGITEWMRGWHDSGWKSTRKRHPLLNQDLWEQVYAISQNYHITYEHITGHSGDEDNERCDALAKLESIR